MSIVQELRDLADKLDVGYDAEPENLIRKAVNEIVRLRVHNDFMRSLHDIEIRESMAKHIDVIMTDFDEDFRCLARS